MSDPFADRSNKQLYREAQVWMAVFTCLLTAFLYLVVKRMTGSGDDIPEHILRSGVAQIEPSQNGDRVEAEPSLSKIELPNSKLPVFANIQPPPQRELPKVNEDAGVGRDRASRVLPVFVHDPPKTNGSSIEPNDIAVAKVHSIENGSSEIDQETESKGQRRARELEKIASALPERLEQLQSSVKQASAILDVDSAKLTNGVSQIASNGFPTDKELPAESSLAVSLSNRNSIETPLEDDNAFSLRSGEASSLIPARALETIHPKDVASVPPRKTSASPKQVTVSNELRPTQVDRPPKRKENSGQPSLASKSNEHSRDSSRTFTSSRPKLDSKFPATHEVVWGDSFFTVAQQYYGDGRWFQALYLANQAKVRDFDSLPQGLRLTIPSTESLTQRFPEFSVAPATRPTETDSASERVYLTKANDTLFNIARRKLGQGSRFFEIIQRNEIRLPKNVRASDPLPLNLRLVLPQTSLQ